MIRRICALVTARPSYSRIRTALSAIRSHPDLELQLVVAASALLERYGNTIEYIEADGFKIAARVYMILEGENLVTSAKSTGLGLVELATTFDNLEPDAVITVADRFETLATAVAASYMNIPVIHVQGGEITGSIDEKVRHAVTKLSNIHLVSSDAAAERVVRLGEDPGTVHVTGCPSIDLAASILDEPASDFDLFTHYGGVGPSLDLSRDYVIVMQHPVTTENKVAFEHVTETLHAITRLDMPALWFWPNVDAGSDGTSKGIRSFREQEAPSKIHFFRNLKPLDFLRVAQSAACIIGNSSVAIREGSFLGLPAVNIGTRQDGRDRGNNVVDVGYDRMAILEAIGRQIASPRPQPSTLYGDGHAGERIANILAACPLVTEKRLAY